MNKHNSSLTSRRNQDRGGASSLFNPAMVDGLAVLRQQSMAYATPEQLTPRASFQFQSAPQPGDDGVTHVNFSISAKSELGQVLSFDNPLRFFHPGLNLSMPSIYHFWMFLQSGGNTRAFKTDATKLRSLLPGGSSSKTTPVRNQYALLMQAYWYKLQEHSLLADVLIQYRGKFDYYLDDHRGVRRPQSAPLLVDMMMALRRALANRTTPNLIDFLDQDEQARVKREGLDSYEDIDALLTTQLESSRLQLEEAKRASEAARAQAKAAKQQPKVAKQRSHSKQHQRGVVVPPTALPLAEAGKQAPAETTEQASSALVIKPYVPHVENEVSAAAPTAPASPASPAAPASPGGGAAPSAPSSPSAPTAQGEEQVEDSERVVVLDGLKSASAVAQA